MVTDTVKMNAEKLKQLQANVRIGGKGTVRRKKKVVHRTATTDDKKLQSSLKKLSGRQIMNQDHDHKISFSNTPNHSQPTTITFGSFSQSNPVQSRYIPNLFLLCSQQHPRH